MTQCWLFLVGLTLGLLALLPGTGPTADAPGGDEWKYDVVHLKNGQRLQGLVLEQNGRQITLKCISRKPGSPTILSNHILLPAEVEGVELLDPRERDLLHKRLQGLLNERKLLDAHLRLLGPRGRPDQQSGDTVTLRPAAWPGDPKARALAYNSTYFQLISNAREEVIQLAAIQLEQVYAAYARGLPPRAPSAKPTTILLMRSLTDYQDLLRDQHRNFFNPAFYDLAKNQVVCGSDLERLSDEMERIHAQHARALAELEERKTELHQVYKGKVPAELLAPLLADQKKIKWTEERNAASFVLAKRRLFQRLYHEAFHAYLATFVYPPAETNVPHWLNEGLAQIFETAIFEVGELRVGHADEERLKAVRQALARNTLLPLTELLRSREEQFLVGHTASAKQLSDRYYLASWALAFHITFERKLLGTKAMDDYVRALKRDADPLVAFSELVGKPVREFEKDHLQYLKHLRPDGTARTTE